MYWQISIESLGKIMIIKFRYINGRTYVNNESFINCILSTVNNINSMSFRFNKITYNNICDLEFNNSAFDKKIYNVTGNLLADNRSLYFGFRETDKKESDNIILNEQVLLNNVSKMDMAWTFTSYFKENCKGHYDQTTQKLLMANVDFINLDKLQNISDFSFNFKSSGSRLQGIFSNNGIVVCKELILIRDRYEKSVE